MDKYFFNGWDDLLRTLVVGVLAYIALVFLLRIFGNRTLSKMNAFDLVVTVALGSILATVLLNKKVALAEGSLAFTLLISLQFLVTWASVRAGWVRRLMTGEPQMLLYRGEFLSGSMRKSRVTEDVIRAALRSSGVADLARTEAVILETDGSFSVVPARSDSAVSSLEDVKGMPGQESRAG